MWWLPTQWRVVAVTWDLQQDLYFSFVSSSLSLVTKYSNLSLSLSLSLFEVQPRRIVGSSSVELLVEVVTGLGFRALRVGPWGSNGVRP
jgi:hypothetical protein